MADSLGVLVLGAWAAHHDDAIGELHLSVADPPIGAGEPHAFPEAERLGKPVQGARNVFVKEVGRDAGHVGGVWPGASA